MQKYRRSPSHPPLYDVEFWSALLHLLRRRVPRRTVRNTVHDVQVMQGMSRVLAAPLLVVQLHILLHIAAAAEKKDIAFVDASWKEYVSKDHDPAWTKGKDTLAEAG